jgi:hypothetical protein
MDLAVVKGFITRYKMGPVEVDAQGRFHAQLPFANVVVEPHHYPPGGRDRATVSGTRRDLTIFRASSLAGLRKAALWGEEDYLLNEKTQSCLSLLSKAGGKNRWVVWAGLSIGRSVPWSSSWQDDASGAVVCRAALDVLLGKAPPQQFLDWLVQRGDARLEKVLGKVYP